MRNKAVRHRSAPGRPDLPSAKAQRATRGWPKHDLPITLILLASAALRLLHLSYSHFQGDEIKALYPPEAAFPDFLFAQRKGPMQFLITRSVGALTGGYVEWQTRLPFSLASLLTVYIVYRLVSEEFGRQAGLLAAALVGSCGLLVAFGRIVQYQSFCMLFMLLTAYFLFNCLRRGDPRLLYPGLMSYSLALLAHYDALSFAPTLALILIAATRRHARSGRPFVLHLILAGTAAMGLASLFYLPYGRQAIFQEVRPYLLSRVVSGKGLQTFTDTVRLLGLYLPPLYLALAVPLLLIGVHAALRREGSSAGPIIVTWFVTTFGFYMLLGGDPRSHVYNYFLPGLILVALGIVKVIAIAPTPGVAAATAWVVMTVFGGLTYYMLVDHTIEHPWSRKTVLGYELPNLESRQVQGVFGFPYRRGLDQVGAWFRSGQLQGTYASNERQEVTNHYFRAVRSDSPDYYIFVLRSRSWERRLPRVVASVYRRVRIIDVEGLRTIEIYEAPWRAAPAGGAAGTLRLSSGPRRVAESGEFA